MSNAQLVSALFIAVIEMEGFEIQNWESLFPPYSFMGESMGLHYLNAFDNQKFNITFLVEVFNGYLKIFNMAIQFLRQITKDSVF